MESEVLLETSQINDEFTLLSLFIRADIVVKLVIFILFAASIISWTIIVHKIRLFKSLREISKKFEEEFWSGRSIKEISKQALTIEDSPIKYVFLEAVEEISRVIRSDGRFVLVLNHPAMQTPESGLIFDHVAEPPSRYWRISDYLLESSHFEEVDKGIFHFRHPHLLPAAKGQNGIFQFLRFATLPSPTSTM